MGSTRSSSRASSSASTRSTGTASPRFVGSSSTASRSWTGHGRAIAAYLRTGDTFDRSITNFSGRYADQNARDFDAFTEAIQTSRIDAVQGV